MLRNAYINIVDRISIKDIPSGIHVGKRHKNIIGGKACPCIWFMAKSMKERKEAVPTYNFSIYGKIADYIR